MQRILLFGTLYAAAIFLWALIEFLIGLQGVYIRYHEMYSYFFAIPAIFILYRALVDHMAPQTSSHWTTPFKFGLGVVLIATLLTPLVWWVFCQWINPDFLPSLRKYHILSRNLHPVRVGELFSFSNFLFMQAVTTAVVGILIALILSIIGPSSKTDTQTVS
jgi:hypothetical protein